MNEYGGSTVDQRVVEMRIDNDKFEAGAKKTISILESLDNSLNNLGRQNADGFANVEKTMDAVTSKFSIMGTVGDQVLRNLTNSAMGMANELKRTVESLTTAQIGAGWNKYADKTSAVQTIMAATHKDIGSIYKDEADQMEKVNEQLEKMMWFSDETSYSFLDMTSNVGKFVAAGKGLEESVRAMMGISNWAAISGGRPAEASRAMYNLSQALGVGAVTTIDWKSIEMANMATYEFKQMAIETAEQMGILRKTSDKTWETVEGNYEVTIEKFRDTLSFGKGADKVQWFSSDVLLEVLSKYGEFTEALQEETEKFGMGATDMLKAIKAFDKIGTENEAEGLEELARIADRCDVSIEDLIPSLQRLGDAEFDLGRRAFQSAQEAKTFAEAIEYTKDAASSQWMKLFEKIFGDYLQAKELWTSFAESLYTIFVKPVEDLNDALDEILGQNVFADILDIDGNIIGAEFLTPFKECEEALENISVAVDDVGNTIQETVDAISSAAFGPLDTFAEHAETTYKNLKAIADIFNSKDRDAFIHKFEWDKINLAGYATEEFKLAVIEAAEELGTLKKVSDDVWQSISTGQKVTVGNFTETLGNTATDGWLTNNILSSEFLKIESGIEKLDSFATRLVDAGYKIPKFWDSLNETLGKQRVDKIAEQYGTMVDAIKQGGITSDEFRHALELVAKEAGHTQDEIAAINEVIKDSDNLFKRLKDGSLEFYTKFKVVGEDSAEEVDSLDSRLKKAGRTMDDLQEALRKVDETRFDSIIAEYGTLDRALKEGAIDAEYFRRAMEEMANDTAKGVDGATQSFTELREVAMQVLRGDWGNGEERVKRLLEAGYDYDTVQWLAGNLGWMIGQGWDVSQISDEYLMNLAKPEHVEEVINNLAETSASVRYTEEEIAEMNALLEDCDLLLEQVESGALDVHDAYRMVNGATDEQLLQYKTGGEVLRETMTNFMNFFSSVADAFNQAAAKVFGGEGGVVEHLGYFIVALYRFSKAIQFGGEKAADGSTKLDRLVSAISGFFRILKGIGSIIGAVWAIVRPILGLALDLIGRIVAVLGDLANGLGDTLDRFSGDSAGRIQAFLTELGSHLGFVSGIFEIFATAILAVIGALVSAGTAVYEFIANSELLSSFISLVSTAFQKVEGVINRVSGYIREAYESAEKGNKAKAAISALLGSVERGFKRIIPYGEQIWAFFQGIWDFLKGGLSGVGSLILTPFAAIESGFQKMWAAIKGEDVETDGVEEKLHPIRDAFTTLLTSIFAKPEEIKQNVVRFLGGIWDGIKEFVSTIRFRDVVSMLRLAVITTIAGDLLEFLHVFKHVKLEFDDMIETLSYMFEDIGFMFRGLAVNFKSTALIKMAVAIGIITWCIYKLTKLTNDVPDAEKKITYIASVIAILMGFMTLLANSLTRNKVFSGNYVSIRNLTVIPQMLGTLVGLAVLVAAASKAIARIHEIGNAKDIWTAFSPVLAILGLFSVLFYALTKLVANIQDRSIQANKIIAIGKTVQKIGSAMTAMAFSILLLIIPAMVFARMASEDWDGMMWGVAVVTGMLLTLFLTMAVLSKIIESAAASDSQIIGLGKSVLQMSRGMLSLALAVTLLLIPIAVLSHMATGEDNGVGLQRGLMALGAILLGLFAFYWLLSTSLVGIDDKQTKAIGNTLLKMAASMMLVATAATMMLVPILILSAMAKEHSDEVWQAVAIVGGLIIAFGAIMALGLAIASKAANTDGIVAFGNMLIKLAAGMLIFSAAAVILNVAMFGMLYVLQRASEVVGKITNLTDTLIALGAIAVILLAFGFAAKVAGQGLLSLAIAFAVFAGGLWVLGHAFDIFADAWPKFKETLKSLGKNIKDHWKLIAVIGGIALAIGLLTAAISNLRKQRTFIGRIAGLLSNAFGNTAKLGTGITNGLVRIVTGIPKALGKMFAGLKTSLTENRTELMNAIVGMIIVITGYIVGIIPTMTNSIVVAVVELIKSIASSLNEHRTEIHDALTDIVTTIFNILGDVLSTYFSKDFWDKLSGWGKVLAGSAGAIGLIKLIKLFTGGGSSPVGGNVTNTSGASNNMVGRLFNTNTVGNSGGIGEKIVDHVVLENTIKSAINKSNVSKEGIGGGTGDDALSPVKYGAQLLKLGLIYAGFKIATTEIVGNEWGKHNAKEAYNGGSNEKIEDVLVAISSTLDEEYKHRTSSYINSPFYDRYHSTNIMFDKSKQVALDKTFEDLQAFIPDLELENFKRQYEEAIDPIAKYIGLAFQHKDANAKLAKSYENIVSELKLSKEAEEAFYESLKHTNDVEQTLSELVYSRYLSVDDINAISDYVDKSVNLEEAVQKLNDYYDILAKRLGITREEFDAQLEAANGLVGNMPAYKEYFEGFTDLLTIASDGSIQLTEKGIVYFEAQRKAAEEATKAAEFEILKQEELKRILEGSEYESAEQAQKYAEAHQALVKEAEDYRKALIEEYKNLGVDTSDVEQMSVTDLLQSREEATNDINAWGDGVKADIKAQIGKLKDEFGINFSLDSLSSMSGFDLFGLITGNLSPEQMGELSSEYGLSLDEGLGFGVNSEEGKQYISNALNEVMGGEGSFIDNLVRSGDYLNINSPSKLFEQYGLWSDMGYANGILSQEGQSAIRNALSTVFAGGMPIVGKRRWYTSLIADGQEQLETDKVRELEDSVNLQVNTKIKNADDAFDGWTELIKGVGKSSIGAFETIGTDSAESYANGILSKEGRKTVLSAFKQVFSATIKTLGQKNNAVRSVMTLLGKPVEISAECKTIGDNAGISLIKGIVARYKDARASGESVGKSFLNAFKKETSDKKITTEIDVSATPKVTLTRSIDSEIELDPIPEVKIDANKLYEKIKDKFLTLIDGDYSDQALIAELNSIISMVFDIGSVDISEDSAPYASAKLKEKYKAFMEAIANASGFTIDENGNIITDDVELNTVLNLMHDVGSIDIPEDVILNPTINSSESLEDAKELGKEYGQHIGEGAVEGWEASYDSFKEFLNSEYYKGGKEDIIDWHGNAHEIDVGDNYATVYFSEQYQNFLHNALNTFDELNDEMEFEALQFSYWQQRSRKRKITGKADTSGLDNKGEGLGFQGGVTGNDPLALSKGYLDVAENYLYLTEQARNMVDESIKNDALLSAAADKTRKWLIDHADEMHLDVETDIKPLSDAKLLTFKEDMELKAMKKGVYDFMELSPDELANKMGLDNTEQLGELLSSKFSDFGVYIKEGLNLGLEDSAGIIDDAFQRTIGDEDMSSHFPIWVQNFIRKAQGELLGIPKSMADTITNNSDQVTDAVDTMGTKMLPPIEDTTKKFGDQGKDIPKSIGAGVGKEQKQAVNSVNLMGISMQTPMANLAVKFVTYGAQIASSLAAGIRSRLYEIQAASREMSQAAQNVSRGVSVGVNSSSQVVESAGTSLANKLKNAFTKTLQIKSPSRVFMELAGYVPQGIAKGVENEEDTAIDSVVVLSQDLIDAVQKSMAQVGVMAQDGFGEELSLKPVVDFSGMSSDIQRMNSVLTNAASMQALRNIGNPSAFNYNTENYSNRNQNKDILDEMHNMSIKLGKLGQEMSSMQVVLNTGVLCGELANGVNSKLGGMATRQRR